MENVNLTPKEQARRQVLSSLLGEHMTLDQAATHMGVSPHHTTPGVSPGELRCIPSSMAIGDVDPLKPFLSRPGAEWCT